MKIETRLPELEYRLLIRLSLFCWIIFLISLRSVLDYFFPLLLFQKYHELVAVWTHIMCLAVYCVLIEDTSMCTNSMRVSDIRKHCQDDVNVIFHSSE